LLAFPRLCGFSGQAPRPLAFDVFYPAAVQAAASATPPSFWTGRVSLITLGSLSSASGQRTDSLLTTYALHRIIAW